MSGVIRKPTFDRVKAQCSVFDTRKDIQRDEEALRELWAIFPRNTKVSHVLLKVVALNQLYRARVDDIDLAPLAEHIAKNSIDEFLDLKSSRAIEIICEYPGRKRYFSFATKFCNWHNEAAYPIYDGNVDRCLWSYQLADQFARPSFNRQDLCRYETFLRVMTALKDFYGLAGLTFKEIDKFLWLEGYL